MDNFLKIFSILASTLAGGTVGVLHATGADKHKTIAGQVAGVLSVAAVVAQTTHDALTEMAKQNQLSEQTPLTAGNVP